MGISGLPMLFCYKASQRPPQKSGVNSYQICHRHIFGAFLVQQEVQMCVCMGFGPPYKLVWFSCKQHSETGAETLQLVQACAL